MKNNYDSTADTLAHIRRVNELLGGCVLMLLQRARDHDASKLVEPEKSTFDAMTPRLKALTYGGGEYKACLDEMQVALKHHYAKNRHHPEHHENGMQDMTLIDLLEMLMDWKAATERHDDGNIGKSIIHNADRFNFGPEMRQVLLNTAREMGWFPNSKEGRGNG